MKKTILPMITMVTLLGSCKKFEFLPCKEDIFFWALAEAESAHNPKLIYEESDGTLSIGLFQLSISDSRIYGCDFKSMNDLMNVEKNEKCAMTIVTIIHATYPNESYQRALGRYWGTLRGPEWKYQMREIGWSRFKNAAKVKGCEI